jgi:hypothetical protein
MVFHCILRQCMAGIACRESPAHCISTRISSRTTSTNTSNITIVTPPRIAREANNAGNEVPPADEFEDLDGVLEEVVGVDEVNDDSLTFARDDWMIKYYEYVDCAIDTHHGTIAELTWKQASWSDAIGKAERFSIEAVVPLPAIEDGIAGFGMEGIRNPFISAFDDSICGIFGEIFEVLGVPRLDGGHNMCTIQNGIATISVKELNMMFVATAFVNGGPSSVQTKSFLP